MHQHFKKFLINLRINLINNEIDDFEDHLIEIEEELNNVWNTKWGNYSEFKRAFNEVNNRKIRIIEKQIKLLDSIGVLLRRL